MGVVHLICLVYMSLAIFTSVRLARLSEKLEINVPFHLIIVYSLLTPVTLFVSLYLLILSKIGFNVNVSILWADSSDQSDEE